MSNEDSDHILSWQSIFEVKIIEIEEKLRMMEERHISEIDKLKRCINLLGSFSFYERMLTMRISGFYGIKKGNLSYFNVYVDNYKRRNEILEELGELLDIDVSVLSISYILSWILTYAKIWDIPFDQLAAYLRENLREDVRYINREDILNHYGVEGLEIWDRLLKI